MGKARQTVTTCDYGECEEHYFGDERPEGWLYVVLTSDESETKERLTFCSNDDAGYFFHERSAALETEVDNGGD